MASPRKPAGLGKAALPRNGRVITVRMPDEVLDAIDRAAIGNFRSRSKEILSRLTSSLAGDCDLTKGEKS